MKWKVQIDRKIKKDPDLPHIFSSPTGFEAVSVKQLDDGTNLYDTHFKGPPLAMIGTGGGAADE